MHHAALSPRFPVLQRSTHMGGDGMGHHHHRLLPRLTRMQTPCVARCKPFKTPTISQSGQLSCSVDLPAGCHANTTSRLPLPAAAIALDACSLPLCRASSQKNPTFSSGVPYKRWAACKRGVSVGCPSCQEQSNRFVKAPSGCVCAAPMTAALPAQLSCTSECLLPHIAVP